MLEGWKERDKKIWDSVEDTIRREEERARLRLEQERREREEAERKRREETERRIAAERKRMEEEAERLRKEAEEKEKRRLEDEEIKKREAVEKERLEREKGAEDLRKNVVIPKADELWVSGLKMLNVCFIPLRLRTICKLFIFLTSIASQDSYYASCQGT